MKNRAAPSETGRIYWTRESFRSGPLCRRSPHGSQLPLGFAMRTAPVRLLASAVRFYYGFMDARPRIFPDNSTHKGSLHSLRIRFFPFSGGECSIQQRRRPPRSRQQEFQYQPMTSRHSSHFSQQQAEMPCCFFCSIPYSSYFLNHRKYYGKVF